MTHRSFPKDFCEALAEAHQQYGDQLFREAWPIVSMVSANAADALLHLTKSKEPDLRNTTIRGNRTDLDTPSFSRASIIAAELDLHGGLTAQELQRRRRAFAVRHHPDRLPPNVRQEAIERMQIANNLIDARLTLARA